jgi:membrane-bound lytic murein transglycosylase D
MKPTILAATFAVGCFQVFSEEPTLDVDALLGAGRAWAAKNLDNRVVETLDQLDEKEVGQVFQDVQRRLQGEYVLDLAALNKTARRTLPLLENSASTRPYAAWLRARLDYFDIAEKLRQSVPQGPQNSRTALPAQTSPTPDAQRNAWNQVLSRKPVPTASELYVERLKPIFAAQRIPTELVWLAEVESAFDPSARSPVGATGLYQLMPNTARSLGLALTPQDERLQPEKSAQAAAIYLRYLHGRFGDWSLALAAYNAGESRLQSIMERYGTRRYDRLARRLPAETQMYVPKVDATLRRREGLGISGLRAPGI